MKENLENTSLILDEYEHKNKLEEFIFNVDFSI